MARPTGRVLTLLELLQSGGTRTVAELADRLGVDGGVDGGEGCAHGLGVGHVHDHDVED